MIYVALVQIIGVLTLLLRKPSLGGFGTIVIYNPKEMPWAPGCSTGLEIL